VAEVRSALRRRHPRAARRAADRSRHRIRLSDRARSRIAPGGGHVGRLRPGHIGLGVRAAAIALDLGFVPAIWEDFDIVHGGDALPAAEPLISALHDPGAQSSIHALGGYDLARAGSVEMLA